MNRRGLTLLEVVVASGLALAVLTVGFRTYAGILKVDQVESRRELAALNAQNAMSKIKQDVRAGRSVSGSRHTLTIEGSDGRVVYRSAAGADLERRTSSGQRVFEGVSAEFRVTGADGIHVTVRAVDNSHRRPIRIETESFVRPRNR